MSGGLPPANRVNIVSAYSSRETRLILIVAPGWVSSNSATISFHQSPYPGSPVIQLMKVSSCAAAGSAVRQVVSASAAPTAVFVRVFMNMSSVLSAYWSSSGFRKSKASGLGTMPWPGVSGISNAPFPTLAAPSSRAALRP